MEFARGYCHVQGTGIHVYVTTRRVIFTLAGKFRPADGIPFSLDRAVSVYVSQHFSCHGNESKLLNCSSSKCYFPDADAGVQCLNG